jgi:pimeloyl-ACP methyl ester carboxylesterase
MNPHSRFVQLKDIRLHYLEWPGQGRTAVLVHGSGLCASTWTPIARALATHFRVLAVDLRGHGDSDKPDGHYTWPEVVGDLPAFIDALRLEDILLVGHSRGGGIAAFGGAQRPDRIWRMALLEPTIHIGQHRPAPASDGAAPAHAHPLAALTRRRRVRWPSHDAVYASWRRSERLKHWDVDVLWAYVKGGTRVREDGEVEIKCPPAVEAQFYETQTPGHLFDTLPNITWPVLLLTTDNPRRQPEATPGYMALKHSSRDFRHHVIAGASHFFPQERPADVARAILDFVRT